MTLSKNKLHLGVGLALVLGTRTSKRHEIMTVSQLFGPAGTLQFAIREKKNIFPYLPEQKGILTNLVIKLTKVMKPQHHEKI